ncbi:MAG TPA: YlxR family protein [Candidatus Dormibacteraeota bacterium]
MSPTPKQRHQPVRTCVACRQEAGKAALIRVVRRPDGSAGVDPTGHAPGRGAYLHRDPACIETARKRRQLERSLGAAVPQELWSQLG